MAFCTNCGSQVDNNVKFCPSCGQKIVATQPVDTVPVVENTAQPVQAEQPIVAEAFSQGSYQAPDVAPVQPVYAPSAQEAPIPQPYAQPVQPVYAPPAQEAPIPQPYAQPVQQAYAPPVQEAPIPQTYAEPVQQATYTPPEPQQTVYQQPVYTAPAQAQTGTKPASKRRSPLPFILGGVGLIAIIAVVLILVLGGKGAKNENLGLYTAKLVKAYGMEMPASVVWEDPLTIELKDDGVCVLNDADESATGTWALEKDVLHVEGGGLDCSGTLKDGVMVLENFMEEGTSVSFAKDGVTLPSDSGSSVETSDPPGIESASDDNLGLYSARLVEMFGLEMSASDMWNGTLTIELKDDGVCLLNISELSATGTWTLENDVLHVEGGDLNCNGTLQDGVMVLENFMDEGLTATFAKDGVTLPSDSGSPVETSDPPEIGSTSDDNLGLYSARHVEMFGIEIPASDMWNDTLTIELEDDGVCLLNISEQPTTGTWTLENDVLHVEGGDLNCDGTLQDGVMVLENYMDEGLTVTFAKDGVVLPSGLGGSGDGFESPDTEPGAGENADPVETLTGNWVGWMEESESWGSHEDAFRDVHAIVDYTDDGKRFFEVYLDDEEESSAVISMWIEDTENNTDLIPIIGDDDAWIFDTYLLPEDSADYNTYVGYDGSLSFIYYYESYDGTSGCRVEVFLRKEGAEWDEFFDTLPPSFNQ